MFCSCKNDPQEKRPNVNICPICMGHPGVLPVPNKRAIEMVIKAGLAFGCQIAEYSKFDRKHYFYPDLPKGYQISQYELPFCTNGKLKIGKRDIRIRRIHLEEDTGRSQHPPGTDYSLVDFNRAGVPLMELVTEPDIKSAKEAGEFARQLQLILRYLDVSDADMEKGQMRVEVNISLSSAEELGIKVEIKNLNSFRAVEQAIAYEIKRQSEILEANEKVRQETRGWDDLKQQTFLQRAKESAPDYRYFPEPDIPPFTFTKVDIEKLRLALPELPAEKRERLQRQYNLSDEEVEMLVRNRALGEYFENVASELGTHLSKDELAKRIKLSVNYLVSDLQGLLEGRSVEDKEFKIAPEDFAQLVCMIADGSVSSYTAKSLLKQMFATGADPRHLMQTEGLDQLFDETEITRIAKEIIEKNPRAAEDYQKGKENALQFLLGQMMAATRGTANPEFGRTILLKQLRR